MCEVSTHARHRSDDQSLINLQAVEGISRRLTAPPRFSISGSRSSNRRLQDVQRKRFCPGGSPFFQGDTRGKLRQRRLWQWGSAQVHLRCDIADWLMAECIVTFTTSGVLLVTSAHENMISKHAHSSHCFCRAPCGNHAAACEVHFGGSPRTADGHPAQRVGDQAVHFPGRPRLSEADQLLRRSAAFMSAPATLCQCHVRIRSIRTHVVAADHGLITAGRFECCGCAAAAQRSHRRGSRLCDHRATGAVSGSPPLEEYPSIALKSDTRCQDPLRRGASSGRVMGMQERDTGTILGTVKSSSQTVYRLIFLDIPAARTLPTPTSALSHFAKA